MDCGEMSVKIDDIDHINIESELIQPFYAHKARVSYNSTYLRLLTSSREICDASVRFGTDRQCGAHRFIHRRRIYVGRWLICDGRWHRRTYDGLVHSAPGPVADRMAGQPQISVETISRVV